MGLKYVIYGGIFLSFAIIVILILLYAIPIVNSLLQSSTNEDKNANFSTKMGQSSIIEDKTVFLSGHIIFDTGKAVVGAEVKAIDNSTVSSSAITDENGNFSIKIEPKLLQSPSILLHVNYTDGSGIQTGISKWKSLEEKSSDVGTIVITDLRSAEIPISNNSAQDSDGSIKIAGIPSAIKQLFAQSYDPDVTPEAFPGEFAERGNIPLNSSIFLIMEALNENGSLIHNLSQNVTVNAKILPSQWEDLEDIKPGTDRIEIPIYALNETSNMWEQENQTGWLEDSQGTVLPEDAGPVILAKNFSREVFAVFKTNHFSWMNVDYPYIGPWKLSSMDKDKRNNDCFDNALNLAKAIVHSDQGHKAFAKVNSATGDISVELADGKGPAIRNMPISDGYGRYRGISSGDKNEIDLHNGLWRGCPDEPELNYGGAALDGASAQLKKSTTFLMAATILHETAHWKEDNKKYPDDDTTSPDEEGNELERDLFGGIVGLVSENGITWVTIDGKPLNIVTFDKWLDPNNWPAATTHSTSSRLESTPDEETSPLEVTISVEKNTFALGENIPVKVIYRNTGTQPIEVMNHIFLEGYPLHFNIINKATGERTSFIGPEVMKILDKSDFVSLQPGETFDLTTNLLKENSTGQPMYKLLNSGNYQIMAVYERLHGVGQSNSNTLEVTLLPGGSISGRITNSTSGSPLANATVKVFDAKMNLLTTIETHHDGSYVLELPPSTYTLEASAPTFLHSTQQNVKIVTGQETEVNFSLSQLLVFGNLRIVLTWADTPRDLDSHLWLPSEIPYHLYYTQKGSIDSCPGTQLDVDSTNGFGPETITFGQRYLNGTYLYAIHLFSADGSLSESKAKVQVFDPSGLIATFDVPTGGEGKWWNVLSIDGATGAMTEINTISEESPAPYPNTEKGCLIS